VALRTRVIWERPIARSDGLLSSTAFACTVLDTRSEDTFPWH